MSRSASRLRIQGKTYSTLEKSRGNKIKTAPTDEMCSSGQMKSRAISSSSSTRGSWRRMIATRTRSCAPMPSATLSCPSTEASTLTSTMYVTPHSCFL